MPCRASRLPALLGVATLLVLLSGIRSPASSDSDDVRWVVGQIDQGFSGAFLMTTAGDGDYTVYQRVLDPLGLSPDADVVCMLNRCYLEIAHVPEDTLARYGGRREDMGALRQRFAAARDAYLAMRSVQADKRPAMVETWRAAIGQLAACLSDSGRCR